MRFKSEKLKPKALSLSPEYRFFREAISEALSSESRVATPWLYGVYTAMRGIVRLDRDDYRCTRSDFENLVDRAHIEEIGLDADTILITGSQANFLAFDDHHVWPKITLLARLASVTRARATP